MDKNTGDYQLVREKNNTYVNQSKYWVYMICKTRCMLLYPINKMYAISEKSGIKWSTEQINFNVHIKITKHCDDKE
jgi:hypothetical protein